MIKQTNKKKQINNPKTKTQTKIISTTTLTSVINIS